MRGNIFQSQIFREMRINVTQRFFDLVVVGLLNPVFRRNRCLFGIINNNKIQILFNTVIDNEF